MARFSGGWAIAVAATLLGSGCERIGKVLREEAEKRDEDHEREQRDEREEGSSRPRAAAEPGIWWVTAREAFAAGDIDGDQVEDFVGLCSDPVPDPAAPSLCAFDGKTFRARWRVPAGAAKDAYAVRVTLVGRYAVAVDAAGVLRVHDATTGAVLGSLRLPDRAERLCADGAAGLWVDTVDRSGRHVDVPQATEGTGPRPATCLETNPGRAMICMHGAPLPECKSFTLPPHVDGFSPMSVAVAGGDAVAAGHHSPGTSYPMLVGFDPGAEADGKARWQRAVAPGDPLSTHAADNPLQGVELAGGRTVTTYETGEPHFIAIDAKDGHTLWDVTSASYFAYRLSAARLYVMRWSRLDVRDATDGRLLGGVGSR
jgi:putative pyrroloquinoline-quinone binding quinoprotein